MHSEHFSRASRRALDAFTRLKVYLFPLSRLLFATVRSIAPVSTPSLSRKSSDRSTPTMVRRVCAALTFWLYFMALPQIMFLLREIRFSLKLVALVGLALLFIVRSLVAPGETPVIDISDSLQNWLLRLNVVTTLLTLAVLAYLQAQTSAGLEEELSRIALTDPLTSLYNRRALVLMSNERMRAARRMQQTFAIAVLDIDHFKNDQRYFRSRNRQQGAQGFLPNYPERVRASDVFRR